VELMAGQIGKPLSLPARSSRGESDRKRPATMAVARFNGRESKVQKISGALTSRR
jgi:hypothetical protein